MKVITSKIFKGKKMFLIDDENYQDGGVIEDNQGQWKYPGQITKINSNNITMKGVPYPVYGVSDLGDKQMMYPNREYKFKGNSVTEYPILAQAGTTVKVEKDGIIKDYDRRSPEYAQMYNSGKLMSYDELTDTYTATPLQTQVVKTNAPQWLIDKRNIEKKYTKEKFVKKSLPKWAGSLGETADNLSENAQKDYEKKVNDKLANIILKRNPKLGKSTEDRLKWAESLTEKERDIVNRSSYANKFLPAMNAYNENQSNLTKNYSTRALLSDADKLAQSVEGTPERFRLFPNAENNIESYVNPGMFIGSMAKGLGNVPKDIKNENYGQAALSVATPLSVGAFAGIGNPSTGQFVNNLVNPLAGTGDLINKLGNKYLPNAHKLNPYAFKPNPEAYYRMIGDEGLADLQNVGYVRSNPNTFYKDKHPFFSKGYPIDGRIGKSVVEDSKYLGNNMIEVGGNNEIGNRFVKNRWADAAPDPNIFVARDKIRIDNPNLKVFEKDWLQGYKQVEVPKTTQNFKSEINWGQWNKEIPENPQLMKEYNAIEQTSKANGSWMKNPDGSKFQGTPEQFVQQNSQNFKKAFGNSKLINPNGTVEPVVHSTNAKFSTFDKSYFGKTDEGYHGEGFYLSPIQRTGFDGEFYQRPYKWIDNKTVQGTHNYGKNKMMLYANPDKIVGDFPVKPFTEIIVNLDKPYNIKSAIGNNGMFDMTNPNIYKTLIPGAMTLGALNQTNEKQFGGTIKVLNTKIVNGQKQYLINE